MALIALDHVSKVYPKGTRPALDDVNLDIERGDFVFLVGASGSGKTTLLSLLLREEEATDGEIRVAGNDLRRLTNRQVPQYRRSIGFVFHGIDMRKVPIVIYPTLHYQNGGLEINGDGFTKEIPNLLVAGEAAGGIHGRNRLMGNSLLDVIVFGRNAGKKAAAKCKNVELGEMNLDHIYKYADELDKADLHTDKVSPLLLPKYARHEQR